VPFWKQFQDNALAKGVWNSISSDTEELLTDNAIWINPFPYLGYQMFHDLQHHFLFSISQNGGSLVADKAHAVNKSNFFHLFSVAYRSEASHSKSEIVKSHYFPYKIAPLISSSGAIL